MSVVHCKKAKFDVYVGRPSKWGNPFRIGKDGSRKECIEKYREWLERSQSQRAQELRWALPELRGKVLGCWCAPKSCHGDVLAELSEDLFE